MLLPTFSPPPCPKLGGGCFLGGMAFFPGVEVSASRFCWRARSLVACRFSERAAARAASRRATCTVAVIASCVRGFSLRYPGVQRSFVPGWRALAHEEVRLWEETPLSEPPHMVRRVGNALFVQCAVDVEMRPGVGIIRLPLLA